MQSYQHRDIKIMALSNSELTRFKDKIGITAYNVLLNPQTRRS